MATPTVQDRASSGATIQLEYGRPEVFALRFLTGKNVASKFPGGRVMFSTDRGPLFLDGEDGSDLEIRIRELRVQVGDYVRVVKVKMPHGGGHSLRIERVSDAAEPETAQQRAAETPTRMEALLEKSIDMVRGRTAAPAPAPVSAELPKITPASAGLCAALKAAIDAVVESVAYGARLGLKLEFNEEDIRALAITCYINANGGR